MVPVVPQTHPWAFVKNHNPQLFIAALELLGDIYYAEYIAEKYPGHAGTHYARATTDNQGNTYILAKHYTSAFPHMCLVMEMTHLHLMKGERLKKDLKVQVDLKNLLNIGQINTQEVETH